jgi:hypothetical protein
MRFSREEKQRQALLSATARRFLEFVEVNPSCLETATFAPIINRQEMRKYATQPWPAFVDRRLFERVGRACVELTRLVKSIPRRLFDNDVAALVEFYNLESDLLAAIIVSEPSGIPTAMSRADFIHGPTGPKCVELNLGSIVGGWQFHVLSKYLRRIPELVRFADQNRLELTPRDTVEGLFRHIVECTLPLPGCRDDALNLAILMPREGRHAFNAHPIEVYNETYARVLHRIADGLPGRVIGCTTADLHYDKSLTFVGDLRAHAILEQNLEFTSSDTLRSFKAGRLNLFTGPAGRILTDKRNLATLSEFADSGLFDEGEARIIHEFVPWTRRVIADRTCHERREVWLPELLLDRRQDLVLKRALSAKGDGVFIGRATEPGRWAELVDEALTSEQWVVQQFLETTPWLFHHEALGYAPHHVVWGHYALGDYYSGSFVRMQPSVSGDLVNVALGARVGFAIEVDE